MRFGSLFAGIGGMDLGLERAGMECAWQVEIDEFCRKVLTKHWPDVPKFNDVREVGAHNLDQVDLICGGFPCQDISFAGKGIGIDGPRSGLWSEFHRIICALRPRYVLVENVAALLVRGMDRVLSDLAASGYDAEWRVFSACEMGFPHSRERLFLIAYPAGGDDTRRTLLTEHVLCSLSARATDTYNPSLPRSSDVARWVAAENVIPPGPCNVHRVVDGVPGRLDGFRGLGNAVIPQVTEWIGQQIIRGEENAQPVNINNQTSQRNDRLRP